MAYDPENNPYIPGDPASYDLKWVVDRLNEHAFAEESAADAKASAEAAAASASEASGYADDAEGYRDAASGFADDASGYADDAEGYRDAAKNYADNIADPVSGLVTAWMDANITQPTTPVVDASLSVSGAAADAMIAGDEITRLTDGAVKLNPDLFANGANNNGVYSSSTQYRIASPNALHFPYDLKITVAAGFRIIIDRLDSADTFVNMVNYAWITTSFFIHANQHFKLTIARTTENTSEVADKNTFLAALSCYSTINTIANKSSINDLNGSMLIELEKGNIYSSTSGWTYNTSDYNKRMRTPQDFVIDLEPGDYIECTDSDYQFAIGSFDDYTQSYKAYNWATGRFYVQYPGAHVFTIRKIANTNLTDAEVAALPSKIVIKKKNDIYREIEKNTAARYPIATYGHRGLYTIAPQNTMESAEAALEHAFTGVEIDIQFTSDNIPVIFHDPDVSTLTDGSGPVSGYTLAALQQLHFTGDNYTNFPNAYIPSLAEILNIIKKKNGSVMIDLGSSHTDAELDSIFETVRKYGMLNRSVWAAWNTTLLSKIKAKDPSATLLLITYQTTLDGSLAVTISDAASLLNTTNRVYIYNQQSNNTTDAQIAAIISAGLKYGVWNYGLISNPHPSVEIACSEILPAWLLLY